MYMQVRLKDDFRLTLASYAERPDGFWDRLPAPSYVSHAIHLMDISVPTARNIRVRLISAIHEILNLKTFDFNIFRGCFQDLVGMEGREE